MKKTSVILSIITLLFAQSSIANNVTEPLDGKPASPARMSAEALEYQVKYQRAFEAVLWSVPAVALYGFYHGTKSVGGDYNSVLAWSKPATPNLEAMTGNNQTPYVVAQTNLTDGPVVLEVPPATNKNVFFGQITDHWHINILNVGPKGLDKGRGGKYLFVPPNYEEDIPTGYFVVNSQSYHISMVFRSIALNGATDEDAYNYSKKVKLYSLLDPKPTQFIDPINKRYSTLMRYDERWFDDIYAMINRENARPRDKVMTGMLASLGIEKGKPYEPDAITRKAMKQAVEDAYYYMQNRLIKLQQEFLWWPDRQWTDTLFHDEKREFTWETDSLINLDRRADRHFYATFYPKTIAKRPPANYLQTATEGNGDLLQAGVNYQLNIPKNMPVKQFWSLVVYDFDTMAFIYNPLDRVGLSSKNNDQFNKNTDGSVTLYFGPKAPKGLESNWIPTQGKKPFLVLRFYGASDAFYDRTFKMPDVMRQ